MILLSNDRPIFLAAAATLPLGLAREFAHLDIATRLDTLCIFNFLSDDQIQVIMITLHIQI